MKVEELPAGATAEDVCDFALHTGQVVALRNVWRLSTLRDEPHGTLQELRFERSNSPMQMQQVTAVPDLTQENLQIHQTPVRVELKV